MQEHILHSTQQFAGPHLTEHWKLLHIHCKHHGRSV